MRIVIVGTRGFPNVQGGVERYCQNLSVNLAKMGCEVIVLTRAPYVDKSIKEFKGVKLVALPAIRHKSLETILHTFLGIFVACLYRPDVLHIQAIGPALFTPLARLLGMKVVITTQGSNYRHKKWGGLARQILKFGEFLGMVFANEIICVSQHISKRMEKRYGRRCHVIPNGVSFRRVAQSDKALRKYALEKGKYILTVGRFVPEKGFADLIDAFQKSAVPDRKLVIVGRADHASRYSRQLQYKARQYSNIMLTGYLGDEPLQELYSHAGLFVLPSYYEGLPLAFLEAMSYGLMCLASDIPAHREMNLPGEHYFAAGNIQQLSTKLQQFVGKSIPEEQRMSQIKMLQTKYDWSDIARKTLEVYIRAHSKHKT